MRRPESPLEGRPPFVDVMRKLGLPADPWQVQVLESRAPQTLLNCCRQAGKSTVVAVLALMEAIFQPLTKGEKRCKDPF